MYLSVIGIIVVFVHIGRNSGCGGAPPNSQSCLAVRACAAWVQEAYPLVLDGIRGVLQMCQHVKVCPYAIWCSRGHF